MHATDGLIARFPEMAGVRACLAHVLSPYAIPSSGHGEADDKPYANDVVDQALVIGNAPMSAEWHMLQGVDPGVHGHTGAFHAMHMDCDLFAHAVRILCYGHESHLVILRGLRIRSWRGVTACTHELDAIDA